MPKTLTTSMLDSLPTLVFIKAGLPQAIIFETVADADARLAKWREHQESGKVNYGIDFETARVIDARCYPFKA